MSEMVDLLSIAERRTNCGATQCKITVGGEEKDASELQNALDEIKQAVSSSIGDKHVDTCFLSPVPIAACKIQVINRY